MTPSSMSDELLSSSELSGDGGDSTTNPGREREKGYPLVSRGRLHWRENRSSPKTSSFFSP